MRKLPDQISPHSLRRYRPVGLTQVKRNALHRWSRWLLLALLPVLATIAMARESRVPGGIAWIDLGARTGALAPTAWFDEHRVMVVAVQDRWRAVVGLPLTLMPGPQRLVVADHGAAEG